MKAILATLFLALPVHAQTPQCAPTASAMATLSQQYGEAPRVQALMSTGQLLVITVGPDGAWTALVVNPDGTACVAAAGVAMEFLPAVIPGVDG